MTLVKRVQVSARLQFGGQAEIGKLRLVAVHQDVRGLDVPVYHSLAVGVGESPGHLLHQNRGLPVADGVPPQKRRQIALLDVIHREIHAAVRLARVVHSNDVRMPQPGNRLRLAQEAHFEVGRCARPGEYRLERHDPAEAGLPGGKDAAHAPATELLDDLVRTDSPHAPGPRGPGSRFRVQGAYPGAAKAKASGRPGAGERPTANGARWGRKAGRRICVAGLHIRGLQENGTVNFVKNGRRQCQPLQTESAGRLARGSTGRDGQLARSLSQ